MNLELVWSQGLGVAQRVDTCTTGPEVVAHDGRIPLESVGQSVTFIQRTHCLEQSGRGWIWGLGPQERQTLPTAILLVPVRTA